MLVCMCVCLYVYMYVCMYVCLFLYANHRSKAGDRTRDKALTETYKAAVHKVRHAIFWPSLTPLPLSHFLTHPGTPHESTSHISDPRFLLGLVQNFRTKVPCTNSISIVRGG